MKDEKPKIATLDKVVEAMEYDILHPQSVEVKGGSHYNVVIHGGNGFSDYIASRLFLKLGSDYEVKSISGDIKEVVDGLYYLDVNWYVDQVRKNRGDYGN